MITYLAIDIGASSGRAILACQKGGKLNMEEIHRFPNHPKRASDNKLYWDIDGLFQEIVIALKKAKELGKTPSCIGIDTWGVDYVLLDENGKKLGHAYSYRDASRQARSKEVEKILSKKELFQKSGIAFQPFNTVYQLYDDLKTGKLEKASCFLQLPDYLNYRLTGLKAQEYCNATTTAMVDKDAHAWDETILETMGFPKRLFGKLSLPGQILGPVSEEIAQEIGYRPDVAIIASHDTASAVLAIPLKPNEPYISSGTWSLLGIESPTAHVGEFEEESGYSNEGTPDQEFRFQINIMGLWIIQEVRHELGDKYSFAELAELAKTHPSDKRIDANDPIFLSPKSMIEAIESKVGKVEVPELAHIVYASLADCYKEKLRDLEHLLGKRFETLHITGGGGKNQFLNALTANAIARPVLVGPIEGTALGNLLMQMKAKGEIKSIEEGRQLIKESFPLQEVLPNDSI